MTERVAEAAPEEDPLDDLTRLWEAAERTKQDNMDRARRARTEMDHATTEAASAEFLAETLKDAIDQIKAKRKADGQ